MILERLGVQPVFQHPPLVVVCAQPFFCLLVCYHLPVSHTEPLFVAMSWSPWSAAFNLPQVISFYAFDIPLVLSLAPLSGSCSAK